MFSEGNVIMVSYTARDKATGKAYDTTREGDAKEAGIWVSEREYKPLPVVFGQGNVFARLEKELEGMSVGETRRVVLAPSEAFGERRPELIRIVALKAFHDKKISPFPGLVVEVDGSMGRVQSVSGGRVRVDFNHELAGKEVEYEITVERKLEGGLEIIRALAQKYFSFLPKEQLRVENEGEEKVLIGMPRALVEAREFKELQREFEEIASKATKERVEFAAMEERPAKAQGKAGEGSGEAPEP